MSDDTEEEKGGFLGDLPTLALAIGVALLIRTFLFQSFYVPSDSMLPTLLVGDHVFVNKFLFGAGVPFSGAHLPEVRTPERGEVVVFELARDGRGGIYPADQQPDLPTDAFVKRAIALPGDRVAVKSGRIILNGEPVPWEATGETWVGSTGREFDVYIERLPGCSHYVLDDPHLPFGDMAEITIKPGRFFFMGDNRDNSHDGRRFGTVRLEELAGPAGLLYWSWDWTGSWFSLLNPLTWIENLTQKTRWSRLGRFRECLPDGEG